MVEHLSAPGQFDEWIQASKTALKSGDFSKIKFHKRKNQMTAKYGSDTIAIDFSMKDARHILLRIESSDAEVLAWYKSCVSDVILHPQKYENPEPEPEESFQNDSFQNQNLTQNQPSFSSEEENDTTEIINPDELNQFSSSSFIGKLKMLETKTWFIWLMVLLIPPYGIYIIIHNSRFSTFQRVLFTILVSFYFLFIWLGFLGVNTGVNMDSIKALFTEIKNKLILKYN